MGNSRIAQLREITKAARAQQPSFGAEIKAMAREAVKDVHNTIQQVFFGQSSGHGEPGTPLNPTPQLVTEDLTGRPMDIRSDMPAPRAGPQKGGPQLDLDRG